MPYSDESKLTDGDSKPSATAVEIAKEHDSTPINQKKRTWRCDVCLEAQFDSFEKAVEHEKGCTKKKVQVAELGPNDVLLVRGGASNHNPGNKRFREMVNDSRSVYESAKKQEKTIIVKEVVKKWRSLDPPGKFVKQDEFTKLWVDVGDEKAITRTSQLFREKKGSFVGQPTEEGESS